MKARKATVADLEYIGQNMRGIERQEIMLTHNMMPYELMEEIYDKYFDNSFVVADDDDLPLCVYGVSNQCLWLLSCIAVERCNVFAFIKIVKNELKKILSKYKCVCSLAYSQHLLNTKFCKFLGAQIVQNYRKIKNEFFHLVVFKEEKYGC